MRELQDEDAGAIGVSGGGDGALAGVTDTHVLRVLEVPHDVLRLVHVLRTGIRSVLLEHVHGIRYVIACHSDEVVDGSYCGAVLADVNLLGVLGRDLAERDARVQGDVRRDSSPRACSWDPQHVITKTAAWRCPVPATPRLSSGE